MSYPTPYQPPDRVAYQSGYQNGYDAGFRAGYEAALATRPQQQVPFYTQNAQQGQPGYTPQPGTYTQLPYRPPVAPSQQQQPPPPPLPARPLPTEQSSQFWQPLVGTSWQIVLKHPVKLNDHNNPISQATIWDIDVFDNPASTVAALHAQGCKVIAYFSAGTFEDWRPDKDAFPSTDLGRKMDDWEGERWLNVRSSGVREVMLRRMDLAVQKGFDGIDPDNMDGYDHKTGLNLTKSDAIDYMLFLAREAHARGLACGLKNGGDIVHDVLPHVDFCVQEQAVQYDGDAEIFQAFITAGKPVLHVEYPKGDDPENKKMNDTKRVEGKKRDKAFSLKKKEWSSIVKNICLDQWVQME